MAATIVGVDDKGALVVVELEVAGEEPVPPNTISDAFAQNAMRRSTWDTDILVSDSITDVRTTYVVSLTCTLGIPVFRRKEGCGTVGAVA